MSDGNNGYVFQRSKYQQKIIIHLRKRGKEFNK